MATSDNGGEVVLPRLGELPPMPPRMGLYLRLVLAAIALLVLIVVLGIVRGVYTNWLWFSNVGYTQVYWSILFTRVWLFAAGFIVSMAGLGLTYWMTWRNAWGPTAYDIQPGALKALRRVLIGGAAILTFLLALLFANALSARWELFLKFLNSSTWGIDDPHFGNDVGFYVFTMPMLHTIQGWLLGLVLVGMVTSAGVYLLLFSIRGVPARFTPSMFKQLAAGTALLMVVIAAAHFLDTFEILLSTSGAVTGATFTDITARLPALRLLTGIALFVAVVMVFVTRMSNQQQALRLYMAGVGLWVVAALLAGLLWPWFVQRFSVEPNELERERPYIERNIEWTRRGFDLTRVQEQPYDVSEATLAADIAANPETVDNIRLWDPRPLLDVYNQIQHLRLYYNFLDPDIDRYVVDGEYRQVILGTRELIQDGLDDSAQTWVNRRLVYTHGYGVVMSPTTDFTEAGQPEFFLQDIPLTGKFEVNQPRIYYGEGVRSSTVAQDSEALLSDDPVVVNTTEPEFDQPPGSLGGPPVFIESYDGDGGVQLSNFFTRAALAWELGDPNIVLSRQITGESSVLYRRHIVERASTIAPFLRYDRDPYMVVHDGRLFWILDAYTVTDRLPYSRRFEQLEEDARSVPFVGFNYIRNSVKVVIDAYNGDVTFYTIEQHGEDPMLQVFENMFPDLFTPIAEMPAGLREHIRYPEVLLRSQAETFLQYHMTDPKEFFLKEDQWEVPLEVIRQSRPIRVEPYYVIMKLPGEEREEFVLILPFTPQQKPNLVAWVAARSDGERYGELLLFTFPTDRLFNGPEQVEARIDNDPAISEQFTLWGQSGSIVIRGNLLVIPIGDSLLYAEPIYLQADTLNFPELKRVILASADDVVMEPTLDLAIEALLGGRVRPTAPAGDPVPGGIPPEELQRALDDLRDALDDLRRGVEGLDDAVDDLETVAGEA